MTIFSGALKVIKDNKTNVEKGVENCIPLPFERMRKYLPGIMRGVQYIVTASSGIGKTQLTKYIFVYSAYKEYKKSNNIDLKILYFALEESRREFMLSMISNYLFEHHNITLTVLDLQSFTGVLIKDEIIEFIEEAEEYFADLDDILDIIDTVSNPTGLYKHVESYAKENGTIITKDVNIDGEIRPINDYYLPKNKDEYVIVIADHIGLLEEERGAETLHKAMSRWSANYARKRITKFFNYVVVNVQQQGAETEKKEFTNRGDSIIEKLLPSLSGLGDNKLTQRDAFVVIGLFAPDRYGISEFDGYNIDKLGDNYRSLIILKNRIGIPNVRTSLFFDGASNDFRELPKTSDLEGISKVYKYKNNLEKQRNNNNGT